MPDYDKKKHDRLRMLEAEMNGGGEKALDEYVEEIKNMPFITGFPAPAADAGRRIRLRSVRVDANMDFTDAAEIHIVTCNLEDTSWLDTCTALQKEISVICCTDDPVEGGDAIREFNAGLDFGD